MLPEILGVGPDRRKNGVGSHGGEIVIESDPAESLEERFGRLLLQGHNLLGAVACAFGMMDVHVGRNDQIMSRLNGSQTPIVLLTKAPTEPGGVKAANLIDHGSSHCDAESVEEWNSNRNDSD